MIVKGKKIGFALTGAFYAFSSVIPKMKELKSNGAEIIPIMSFNSYKLYTNIRKTKDFINEIQKITCKDIIHTIQDAEPIGRKNMTDVMVIAPCSGNTISKIAYNIIDTPVTMAVKSHLRNGKPLVIAPCTIDGLSSNAENIGKLLNKANYYFVPFRQDNPITKPRSIVFDSEYIIKTIKYALEREQISPILL